MKVASLIVLIFAAGLAAIAQSTPQSRLSILTQPGSPAVLSAGRVNGAPAAMLRNRSGRTIIAYRLGWLDPSGKPALGQRTMRRVAKGERIWVRPREFALYPDAHFFIAEVTFGDGTGWKADVNALRRKLTDRVVPKSVPV